MIYKLQGCAQNYAWGGYNYIPDLFQLQPEEKPYAEWWLGDHKSAPAQILVNEKWYKLDDYIQQHAEQILAADSITKYGLKLPYLLKILDVAKPLSIQLHPTKQQAEIGFAAENQAKISLDSPIRTYKDDNHKPEMMIALSDFWLLHGFKPLEKIKASLNIHPSLQLLLEKLESCSLHEFYSYIMQAEQKQLADWLLPIIKTEKDNYQTGKLSLDNPDYWLLASIEAMDIKLTKLDAGLLCFYLFNIVHLNIGEGIYQAAGIPHAYLRGQNIELMSASDNVIRGGLTPKHVDIEALLATIDCSEINPLIIQTAPKAQYIYPTASQDFALEHIQFKSQTSLELHAKNTTIVLVMQGQIKLTNNDHSLLLKTGDSALITYNSEYILQAIEDGYCVLATLP